MVYPTEGLPGMVQAHLSVGSTYGRSLWSQPKSPGGNGNYRTTGYLLLAHDLRRTSRFQALDTPLPCGEPGLAAVRALVDQPARVRRASELPNSFASSSSIASAARTMRPGRRAFRSTSSRFTRREKRRRRMVKWNWTSAGIFRTSIKGSPLSRSFRRCAGCRSLSANQIPRPARPAT